MLNNESLAGGLLFVLIAGIFHWTIHVLAAMAKEERLRNWGYFLMESLYLILQFGIFGVLITTVLPIFS